MWSWNKGEYMSETLINQNQINPEVWQKPSNWIDIRSGALLNSVYFLVGHSEPTESGGTYTVANYPLFAVKANVSNSGTYDVFVDGLKIATTATNTMTVIDWGALYTNETLVGGHNVTYPTNLVTHVVRITPTASANTLTGINASELQYNSSYVHGGTLWIHFALSNSIWLAALAGSTGDSWVGCPLLEAITAQDDVVHVSSLNSAFGFLENLKSIPVFDGDNQNVDIAYVLYNNLSLRKLHLRNFQTTSAAFDPFFGTSNGLFSELILENSKIKWNDYMMQSRVGLKKIPVGFIAKDVEVMKTGGLIKVEDTVLDFSDCTSMKLLEAYGVGQGGCTGIKGITVSPSAPFDSSTSPQILVAYTGLDRVALVNLFNSMPYNVGYAVVGSPTINNGVVSGFNNSDYLQLSQQFDITKDFECVFSVKTGSSDTISNYQRVWYYDCNGTNGIWINNRVLYWWIATNDASHIINNGVYTIQPDTDYLIRARHINGIYYLDHSIDNGQTWRTATSQEFTNTGTTTQANTYLGNSTAYQYAWLGSIDLNSTYIEINGVPWFRGTAAMTKTCSVVGCSGTADLTAADKAIATDKGWDLTVA